ncbi:MAG: DUF2508 family protein [Paenibacillaceae bacterium]|nr:DUF2508 family protein [Paenibacillaceae bacterium]
MGILRRLTRLRRDGGDTTQSKRVLYEQIHAAHADWEVAFQRLDWAVQQDEIDYAIFALEAAEKRFEMLLRQAKQYTWESWEHHAMRPLPVQVTFTKEG